MEKRMKFILEWRDGLESKAELCRRYGVSRRIGYKWAERYERDGPRGLEELSRAAKNHPNQTPAEVLPDLQAVLDGTYEPARPQIRTRRRRRRFR